MAVTIENLGDWEKVAKIGGPVVDPMILRCGDIFLLGPGATTNDYDEWNLLETNLHALGTFFDRIVLDEQIPVFDYEESFAQSNLSTTALSEVNAQSEVLVDVTVTIPAYMAVEAAAKEELMKLYDKGEYGVAAGEAMNILGELSAAGYKWYPFIPDIPFDNDMERRLAGYILAGLVFGGYAQLAGADHLMQPKRSRLFLATALKSYGPRSEESALFDKLNALPAVQTGEIPFTPTFFPMLLHQSSDPRTLLAKALQIRDTSEVREYREWLNKLLLDFSRDGRVATGTTREVNAILEAVRSRSGALNFPNIEIKTSVSGLIGKAEADISVDLTELAASAWGWFVERLPGRRYRKLLSRAMVLDREYVDLRRRAETVWRGRG